jgi:hypothetical protein
VELRGLLMRGSRSAEGAARRVKLERAAEVVEKA